MSHDSDTAHDDVPTEQDSEVNSSFPVDIYIKLSDQDRMMMTLERVKNIESEMWSQVLSIQEMTGTPHPNADQFISQAKTEIEILNIRRTNILALYNQLQQPTSQGGQPTSSD